MTVGLRRVLMTALALVPAAAATAQPAVSSLAAATTYRVFLSSGEPLPSYGEPVVVDDRVIFNLLVDPSDAQALQLVSLPLSDVDGERTARYTEAMRAAHYGATRGELDYLVLTADVARVLDDLRSMADPRQRLALAERVRRQLVAWPAEHHQYRIDDVRGLAASFDGVIRELRTAVGQPGVTLDFIAGRPPLEPILAGPTLRETIALALRAASLADNGVERVEILRRASGAAARLGDAAVLRTVDASLAEEQRVGPLYTTLLATLRDRATRATVRGDVAALQEVLRDLDAQDGELGRRRPADVAALRRELASSIETASVHRDAFARYDAEIGARRRYAGRLRPVLARIHRAEPGLLVLRDMRGVSPARLAEVDSLLVGVLRDLDRIDAPAALVDVHVTLRNALLFARQAVTRRRLARSSQADEMRESSSAAAGALLLLGQVPPSLEASLRRPSIQ